MDFLLPFKKKNKKKSTCIKKIEEKSFTAAINNDSLNIYIFFVKYNFFVKKEIHYAAPLVF